VHGCKNKIGVGIIGLSAKGGWAANAHVPALERLPNYEIRGLSASSIGSAKAAAEKFHIPHFFDNAAALANHPGIDLLVVTVKVLHHAELVTAALRAGKMVFCEWPLGQNFAETSDLAALARTCGCHTIVGLQSRSVPAVNYAKDLIRHGYVGEVLSASVVGSGIFWGPTIPATSSYTLAHENGAGMINVSFAHGLDSVCYLLGSKLKKVTSVLANRRNSVEIIETKEMIPMTTPDQVIVGASMESGAVISIHYRGGLSRATNFHCEINGTRGDLLLTGSLGYPGIGEVEVQGGRDADLRTQKLPIPADYIQSSAPAGMAEAVFYSYARLESDLASGNHFSPNFEDAAQLHCAIEVIETAARNGTTIGIAGLEASGNKVSFVNSRRGVGRTVAN
jgi:predicted dehydrogenase